MTIISFFLCIVVIVALHTTVVQKNKSLTNRVCLTGANILISLVFIVLVFIVNTIRDEANGFVDQQISQLEQKVNEIYPDAMNIEMSTVELKEMLVASLQKSTEGTLESTAENFTKTMLEDYTSGALEAIQALERKNGKLSVKDALVSIKEMALNEVLPYFSILIALLYLSYAFAIGISIIVAIVLAKPKSNGLVFGEEANKTALGMKTKI